MKRSLTKILFIILCLSFSFIANAQDRLNYEMIDRIRDEGLYHSQVMELARFMTDVYGPRLANSPSFNQAAQWAQEKFQEYGINAEMQAYGEVGLGWENKYTSVHMIKPQYQSIIAYPRAWSRGTTGKVKGKVVYINSQEIYSQSDLEQYRDKIRGRIVLIEPKRELKPDFTPDANRLSDEELNNMACLRIIPKPAMVTLKQHEYDDLLEGNIRKILSRDLLNDFFETEGVAVRVSPGRPQDQAQIAKGNVSPGGGRPLRKEDPKPLPHVVLAAEHYNRIVRILEIGIDVELEIEVRVKYDEEDLQDYNIIAEIPGSDLKDEIVMLGAHFDAASSGTGATDNAAGSSVVIEAMRILKVVGAKPRRTIRAALWGGEEIGHLGSRAYVKKHFGNPATQQVFSDHSKLSVYFNTDWYGLFRGLFLYGNDLVRPIFKEWMKPFNDLGFSHLSPGNNRGSDNMSFLSVGLPGFRFIQDDLEFWTTTWHTSMDVYDRLVAEDLIANSVIMAGMVYLAAMHDDLLPRSNNMMNNNRRWHKK